MPDTKEKISVFFSYGHDSEEIVLNIKNDLEAQGFDVWMDRAEINVGNEWRAKITEGILQSDVVMAFLSKHALRKNGVCLNELSIAVGCKQGYIKSVLLEPDIDYLIPSTISGIQYCDMSRWKVLKNLDAQKFNLWYKEKLQEIVDILSSKEAVEMNSQLKYLEQMLSPAMWQARQQRELQKPYVARVDLEQAIEKWMETNSRTFLLYGQPGSGKSNFLINFHHFNHKAGAIVFCDWKRKGRDKVSEIVRSIAFQLATKIPAYRTALTWNLESKAVSLQEMDDFELFNFLLVKPFSGAIQLKGETYLVLVDAINDLNEKSVNPLAEIIAQEGENLPEFIKFVISSRQNNVLAQYFPDVESYHFVESSDEAISCVAEFYQMQLGSLLNNFDQDKQESMVEALAQKSEGNFLFAELSAKAILEGKMSLEKLDLIPTDLNGVYYRWFTSVFPDDDLYLEQYYTPLSILCALDDPIPLDLLKNVMEWSNVDLNKFTKLLKDFLKCQQNAFGKTTATIFHSSMKGWLLSSRAGCFQVDGSEGLSILKKHLTTLFDEQMLTPYQCKLMISVLEKDQDDSLRRKVYGSQQFFQQYYCLAKEYEKVRSGYHKAILIYTHLKEICQGLPSQENQMFLKTVYPFAIGRCYCQTGDYASAMKILSSSLAHLEEGLSKSDLMEVYYILGSVYDWFGDRKQSLETFKKLNQLALEQNDGSYVLRAMAGLIWGEHFTNIDYALTHLDRLEEKDDFDQVDKQMAKLIRARILLSIGQLEEASQIYDECLLDFDFSFNKDVRGYRKNRLMLIEILPACYDVNKFEKGVAIGKQILKKIKNTGWLEECYCSSWVALNYFGMGDLENTQLYLQRSFRLLNSIQTEEKSHWMAMHLASIQAFLSAEKQEFALALQQHKKVAQLADECNDWWVEGDACFEICKLSLLFGLEEKPSLQPYFDKLQQIAQDSQLAHLKLKTTLLQALWTALDKKALSATNQQELDQLSWQNPLASTNYIDLYCIKALTHKLLSQTQKAREAVKEVHLLVNKEEFKNRPSAKFVLEKLMNLDYIDFNVEYCNPFDEKANYWMRLEHLGRYVWASDFCFNDTVVCDVACANGYGSLLLGQKAKKVVGFDKNANYLQLASQKDNVQLHCCDLDEEDLNKFHGQFDLIVSFETIEHVKNPQKLLDHFQKIAKPNATLLLSFPNAKFEKFDENGVNKDVFHLHLFQKEQMIDLLQQRDFEVVEVLGQSYCNCHCVLEEEAIKKGELSLEDAKNLHKMTATQLIENAHNVAIPNTHDVDNSYSYVLHCKRKGI